MRAMADARHAVQGRALCRADDRRTAAPKLIEYNVRFGDPECQVLMLRLKSDLLPAAARRGRRAACDGVALDWRDDAALCRGDGGARAIPDAYAKGTEISGLDAAARDPGVQIFHAGTARRRRRIVANGGRVLNVTARGSDIAEAQARAYAAVDKIDWPDGFCRRDIGWRAVEREAVTEVLAT